MKHLVRKSRKQKPIETFAFQRQDYLDTCDETQSYQAPQLFSVGKAKDLMAGLVVGPNYDSFNGYTPCNYS